VKSENGSKAKAAPESDLEIFGRCALISQKVFVRSFCKGQFPHKSVDLSFLITIIKDKLTAKAPTKPTKAKPEIDAEIFGWSAPAPTQLSRSSPGKSP